MRHAKVGRKLSRSASHRKALLSALSVALIKHKRIQTTVAKAKETRRIVEPLITRARNAYLREKNGEPVDTHSRRLVAKFIHDKQALNILFSEIAEKVGKRQGGYTRVLKLGGRLGDNAEMAIIELVDYNEAQDSKQRKDRVARSRAAMQRRKAAEERKEMASATAAAETEATDEAIITEHEQTTATENVEVKIDSQTDVAKSADVQDDIKADSTDEDSTNASENNAPTDASPKNSAEP